ncbi:MAG: DUF1080 domain-containing protein [Acidobacteria bacterium]|nr:DUF1080 domain-containing protein [Acidobacteriota bacterium]
MKICPNCRKTYNDDGLNFCLEDGSVLTLVADKLPDTVMMNQPRYTNPNPGVGANQPGVRSSFGNQENYALQPKKKSSKAWIWVVGILGVLLLACGGGFGAFFLYVASLDTNSNVPASPTPVRGGGTPTPTPFPRNEVKNIDLQEWVEPTSSFGNKSFTGGEFFMSSKKKGYYYVVAAPEEYKTGSASTSVTMRNVDGADSTLGYGLVFHSNPTPLQKGYAFLLDTKKEKYRVVRHEPGKEIDVVNWTTSNAIKSGSSENTLEVRDTPDRIELYINGEMVTTIKNSYGYPGGVVGLYSGDAVNVAFKNLEIAK